MRKFTLRLPDDLGEAIEKMAADSDRSLNAEIIQAIKFHLYLAEAKANAARAEADPSSVVSHEELKRQIEQRRRITEGDKRLAEIKAGEHDVWVHAREWEYLQEALKFAKEAGFNKIDESELTEL